MNQVLLQLPILSHPKAVYAQVRPYRKGGIRLARETIGGKHIIHNYGHGGAGVTLGPASAFTAVELAQQLFTQKKSKSVAIIGCGINGLLTSIELAKKGYKVKIYADRIPKIPLQGQNQEMIPSEIAPGYWMPTRYDSSNREKHKQMCEISLKFYQERLEKGCQSISVVNVYDQITSKNELMEQVSEEIIGPYKEVKKIKFRYENLKVIVGYGGSERYPAIQFQTLRIDLPRLLSELFQEAINLGILFYRIKFENIENVLALNQDIVCNCLGMGAKTIFKDDKMVPIRGHMLQFDNLSPENYNYFLKVAQKNQTIMFYCHKKRILVGLTYQVGQSQNKVNPLIVDKLKEALFSYLKRHRQINPKL